MKKNIYWICSLAFFVLLVFLLTALTDPKSYRKPKVISCSVPQMSGTCTGSANCTACTNCNYCGYCSNGGSCGVCSGNIAPSKAYDNKQKPTIAVLRSDYVNYLNTKSGIMAEEMELIPFWKFDGKTLITSLKSVEGLPNSEVDFCTNILHLYFELIEIQIKDIYNNMIFMGFSEVKIETKNYIHTISLESIEKHK